MREFGLIDQQIYHSSIFLAGPVNRAIFMDSVVLASSDDAVHMPLWAFARITGWSVEQVEEAARVHMSEDRRSRTKILNGRRWAWIDENNHELGFRVVNRALYKKSSPETLKAYKAKWARENRARVKAMNRGELSR